MALINAVAQNVQHVVEARLCLSSTDAAISNASAAGTLYFTPFLGNTITLYSNSLWRHYKLTQTSIAVPASAATIYDVFCYASSGTPTLELLAWTNDTTRATAIAYQDGIPVKSGDATRLYLGTIRTIGASQVTDNASFRHLYNYYNRVTSSMNVNYDASSWTWAVANTTRYTNDSIANAISYVCGLQGSIVHTTAEIHHATGAYFLGIGDNSATTFSSAHQNCTQDAGSDMAAYANLLATLPIGYHNLSANERLNAATSTFVSTNKSSLARCKIFGTSER